MLLCKFDGLCFVLTKHAARGGSCRRRAEPQGSGCLSAAWGSNRCDADLVPELEPQRCFSGFCQSTRAFVDVALPLNDEQFPIAQFSALGPHPATVDLGDVEVYMPESPGLCNASETQPLPTVCCVVSLFAARFFGE